MKQVKFAPKLRMTIENADGSSEIAEGSEARFVCRAEANPTDITYKWFVNNEMVVGDYTTEMVSVFFLVYLALFLRQ